MSDPETESARKPSNLSGWLILGVCVFINAVQTSAVTVASAVLPQIRGDLSASLDQISWIVTASIVAGALGTPPTPWLSARFGLKTLMVICLLNLTLSSALIGTADSLGSLVLWRIWQALLAAPIIVLTQTVALGTFPPERRGLVVALWLVGVTGGWVTGPTLGALVAELSNWRVAFLIFGPLGLTATLLAIIFLPRHARDPGLKFDWFGFGVLSVGLASLQLVLNRGQRLDWFESPEIIAFTILGLAAVYFFVVHSFTSTIRFLDWRVFKDRNLTIGLIILSVYAFISLAPLVLIPTMLQDLKGLEVVTIGLLLLPRGLVQLIAMIAVGPLMHRLDPRLLIVLGCVCMGGGSLMMANYNLGIGIWDVLVPSALQGIGMGFIAVPTMNLTYSTLSPQLRTDAATLVGIAYTIASSAGVTVSVMFVTRSAQRNTAQLSAHVVPTNELLHFPGYADTWDLGVLENLAAIQGEIGLQALMISYANVYWLLGALCIFLVPLVGLIGRTKHS